MLFDKTYLNTRKPKGWIKGFSKTNSIFIHIPKSAGTSISHALYGEDPWHYKPRDYEYLSRALTAKLFKFTFVRNPYERIASTYKYSFKQVKENPNTSIKFITSFQTFGDFIRKGLTKELVNSHYFLQRQSEYTSYFKNSIGLDFVGRFENLHDDFEIVKKQIGIDCKLLEVNRSPSALSAVYDERLAEIVFSVYEKDFELFQYSQSSYLK